MEGEEIERFVWSRIGNYAHQSPEVSLDPPTPRGLVGIETFAAMNVPSPLDILFDFPVHRHVPDGRGQSATGDYRLG